LRQDKTVLNSYLFTIFVIIYVYQLCYQLSNMKTDKSGDVETFEDRSSTTPPTAQTPTQNTSMTVQYNIIISLFFILVCDEDASSKTCWSVIGCGLQHCFSVFPIHYSMPINIRPCPVSIIDVNWVLKCTGLKPYEVSRIKRVWDLSSNHYCYIQYPYFYF